MSNILPSLSKSNDFFANPGRYAKMVEQKLHRLEAEDILGRIQEKDFTVWRKEDTEISNRLGWLQSPVVMQSALKEIVSFSDQIKSSGFKKVVLLGMGGSSLAPEVFRDVFGVSEGYPDLTVVDTTDPGFIRNLTNQLDLSRTLFLVSTKSGGTVETISLMKYFYNLVFKQLGSENVGPHFVAITDPGSGLEKMAKDLAFRKIFLNDPDIGGRYSALSYFGLVPAALIGIDVSKLLDEAVWMAERCQSTGTHRDEANTTRLGVLMGLLALNGRDKLTFFFSSKLLNTGAWLEQLIAESLGKEGKGVLPVVSDPTNTISAYRDDRMFVYIRLKKDHSHDAAIESLMQAGHPVICIHLENLYSLAGEFYRWELATAIAGVVMGINPFDQPNVESAKVSSREMVAAFIRNGQLPELPVTIEENQLIVASPVSGTSLAEHFEKMFAQLKPDFPEPGHKAYVAVHAYLEPSTEHTELLNRLQDRIANRYGVPVTIGYGPRFLHSTGQLHKGDSGKGLFIQIVDRCLTDCMIPDTAEGEESSISFGVLKMAQALGDREALGNAGRQVITVDLGTKVQKGLNYLIDTI
ncbi:MAG: glucose-6-phosphate isomerase [Calditrichales bacterium]|nr:MAG: glucose-6-phosphate isomerase [Calditrichales bacterium]